MSSENPRPQIIPISMVDKKTLWKRKRLTPHTKLKPNYRTKLNSGQDCFLMIMRAPSPPLKVSDMRVNLENDEKGREKPILWGTLYGLSRIEFLVLRKTLTDYLDKGWISASSFPGGTPVLFVKMPRGGLRFFVDY